MTSKEIANQFNQQIQKEFVKLIEPKVETIIFIGFGENPYSKWTFENGRLKSKVYFNDLNECINER